MRADPVRGLQRRSIGITCAIGIVLVLVIALAARAADPSTLWHIVHDRCVPHQQQDHDPAPCTAVDLAGGYAVLKDIRGDLQFLLIPTARVSGIDDPSILAPDAPNYWQPAWQARRYVEQRAGHALPRDVVSLAINSAAGRSQDQLHIHVDCLRADVNAALHAHQAAVGPDWTPFPVALAGTRYRAMRIEQDDLADANPFLLLAKSVPAAEMRWHTLVVAGATFGNRPGFILLDGRADLAAGDRGHGEALQDHNCVSGR